MEQSPKYNTVHIDEDTGFSLTRRSMLAGLGVAATVGLAGCSDAIQTEFTAPIVGYPEGTEWVLVNMNGESQFTREPVLVDYMAEAAERQVDLPAMGETTFRLNLRGTTYDIQATENVNYKFGFLSVPIPNAGGQEFHGPLAGTIDSLVNGSWGLELFNQIGFTDRTVSSVEYGSIEGQETTESINQGDAFENGLVESAVDAKGFTVVPTFPNGETGDEYFMVIARYQTQSGEVLQGADRSYILTGFGANWSEFLEVGLDISDGFGDFGIIPEPDL